MSYSYIKSVFPNFETSKMYDKNTFNSLYSTEQKTKVDYKVPSAYDETDINKFAKNLIRDTEVKIEGDQTRLIENYTNLGEYKPLKTIPRDNLSYYHLPVSRDYMEINKNKINSDIQRNVNMSSSVGIEKFEQTQEVQNTCDMHIKHALECTKCKNILLKQFNIEYDRLRNEEIMEVISYMIFGLFILLLIDNISKK